MKLEDQVCSLEFSKRLKELGVKQDSLFYFFKDRIYYRGDLAVPDNKIISAFTVAELGEMLPKNMPSLGSNDESGWYMHVFKPIEKWIKMYPCKTEANARAKMLIYLLENNLIKNEELK